MPPKKSVKKVHQPLQLSLSSPHEIKKAQDDRSSEHIQSDAASENARSLGTDTTLEPLKAGSITSAAAERAARFKALRTKFVNSSELNRKEVIAEHNRLKSNPALVSRMERKKEEAEMKLAKEEALEKGEDFERKRAWDWTIGESETWDKRTEKKARNRENALFSDYTQAAQKEYKKTMRNFVPDIENYKKEKAEALSRGQVIQLESGELVAVDEDKRFFRDANSLDFVEHKPSKAAIDRLVADTKKQEEAREAKRRRKGGDEDDISYINQRNKVYNLKLSRFYDKYTRETREALERGSGV